MCKFSALFRIARVGVDSTRIPYSDIGSRECYTATLFVCYDLIRPDVAQYLSWKAGLNDFTMPCEFCFRVSLDRLLSDADLSSVTSRSSLRRTPPNRTNGFTRKATQGAFDKNSAKGRARSLTTDLDGFKSVDAGVRRGLLKCLCFQLLSSWKASSFRPHAVFNSFFSFSLPCFYNTIPDFTFLFKVSPRSNRS